MFSDWKEREKAYTDWTEKGEMSCDWKEREKAYADWKVEAEMFSDWKERKKSSTDRKVKAETTSDWKVKEETSEWKEESGLMVVGKSAIQKKKTFITLWEGAPIFADGEATLRTPDQKPTSPERKARPSDRRGLSSAPARMIDHSLGGPPVRPSQAFPVFQSELNIRRPLPKSELSRLTITPRERAQIEDILLQTRVQRQRETRPLSPRRPCDLQMCLNIGKKKIEGRKSMQIESSESGEYFSFKIPVAKRVLKRPAHILRTKGHGDRGMGGETTLSRRIQDETDTYGVLSTHRVAPSGASEHDDIIHSRLRASQDKVHLQDGVVPSERGAAQRGQRKERGSRIGSLAAPGTSEFPMKGEAGLRISGKQRSMKLSKSSKGTRQHGPPSGKRSKRSKKRGVTSDSKTGLPDESGPGVSLSDSTHIISNLKSGLSVPSAERHVTLSTPIPPSANSGQPLEKRDSDAESVYFARVACLRDILSPSKTIDPKNLQSITNVVLQQFLDHGTKPFDYSNRQKAAKLTTLALVIRDLSGLSIKESKNHFLMRSLVVQADQLLAEVFGMRSLQEGLKILMEQEEAEASRKKKKKTRKGKRRKTTVPHVETVESDVVPRKSKSSVKNKFSHIRVPDLPEIPWLATPPSVITVPDQPQLTPLKSSVSSLSKVLDELSIIVEPGVSSASEITEPKEEGEESKTLVAQKKKCDPWARWTPRKKTETGHLVARRTPKWGHTPRTRRPVKIKSKSLSKSTKSSIVTSKKSTKSSLPDSEGLSSSSVDKHGKKRKKSRRKRHVVQSESQLSDSLFEYYSKSPVTGHATRKVQNMLCKLFGGGQTSLRNLYLATQEQEALEALKEREVMEKVKEENMWTEKSKDKPQFKALGTFGKRYLKSSHVLSREEYESLSNLAKRRFRLCSRWRKNKKFYLLNTNPSAFKIHFSMSSMPSLSISQVPRRKSDAPRKSLASVQMSMLVSTKAWAKRVQVLSVEETALMDSVGDVQDTEVRLIFCLLPRHVSIPIHLFPY
jgi:hypothetical protein